MGRVQGIVVCAVSSNDLCGLTIGKEALAYFDGLSHSYRLSSNGMENGTI